MPINQSTLLLNVLFISLILSVSLLLSSLLLLFIVIHVYCYPHTMMDPKLSITAQLVSSDTVHIMHMLFFESQTAESNAQMRHNQYLYVLHVS